MKVPIPTTVRESRRILESKNGFIQNLPIPTIQQQCTDGYSFVYPSLALEMKVMFGVDLEIFLRGENLSEPEASLHTRSIFRFPILREKINSLSRDNGEVLIVPFGLWSDGFDAGNLSKANRSTVKLTTIHICHPMGNKDHVSPIAFGKNKADHESIREIIWNDISTLISKSWSIFVPSFGCSRQVRFVMAYMVQDRPEHSDWTGFSSHSGLFSTVPGVSSPLNICGQHRESRSSSFQVLKQLASCRSCYIRRKDYYYNVDIQGSRSYERCCMCNDWDMLACTFKPHNDYPTTSPHYQDIMCAKEITFDTLRLACESIWKMTYERKWKRSEVSRFGQYECLKRDVIAHIWDVAKSSRPTRNNAIGDIVAPPMPLELLPSGLRQQILELKDCLVGVMHTLILNIGKHLMLTMIALLKERKLWNTFRDVSDEMLFTVQSMSLSWCKAWSYGSIQKPTSVWVSENFLAFSIVCKSMSSMLHHVRQEEQRFIDIIQQVLSTYNCLVSMVMSPFENTHDKCDQVTLVTKLFLSHFHELDRVISTRSTSKIESAASLLNILGLGEQMKRCGVMRNYWEGSINGEAYIQVMKPLINRGVELSATPTFAMKKCYRRSILTSMRNDLKEKMLNQASDSLHHMNDGSANRYRRFHAYKNLFEVEEVVMDLSPLAAFFDPACKEFFILLGWGGKKTSIKILLSNIGTLYSTTVFDIDLSNDGGQFTNTDFDEKNGKLISCLLLPLKCYSEGTGEEITTKYYTYTEHHTELCNQTFDFEFPRIHMTRITVGELSNTSENNVVNGNSDVFDVTNRELCLSFVGKRVSGIDAFSTGTIIEFKYCHNRRTFEDALWTVEYIPDALIPSQAPNRSTIHYNDLMERLIE